MFAPIQHSHPPFIQCGFLLKSRIQRALTVWASYDLKKKQNLFSFPNQFCTKRSSFEPKAAFLCLHGYHGHLCQMSAAKGKGGQNHQKDFRPPDFTLAQVRSRPLFKGSHFRASGTIQGCFVCLSICSSCVRQIWLSRCQIRKIPGGFVQNYEVILCSCL